MHVFVTFTFKEVNVSLSYFFCFHVSWHFDAIRNVSTLSESFITCYTNVNHMVSELHQIYSGKKERLIHIHMYIHEETKENLIYKLYRYILWFLYRYIKFIRRNGKTNDSIEKLTLGQNTKVQANTAGSWPTRQIMKAWEKRKEGEKKKSEHMHFIEPV